NVNAEGKADGNLVGAGSHVPHPLQDSRREDLGSGSCHRTQEVGLRRTLMRHSILSVSSAKARLLELTRKVNEEGKAYLLTKDGEPVSALVPVEDYEALLETHDILVDHKTMKDLAAALDDEKRSRLSRRDQSGRWPRLKK